MNIGEKKVSSLVLGTATYGGGVCEADAFRLMDIYRECGGNVFDTARVYGESESVLGRYIASCGCRDGLIISTKGAHYDVITKKKRVSAEDIRADIDTSLKNLKTDHIDIYWLHRDDEDIAAGEIVEMLAPIVKSGKAVTLGVSNWRFERIKAANEYADAHRLPRIIASQIKHSAAVTVHESDPTILSLDEESRGFYKNEKMPIFAYTSQAKGLFSKLEKLGIEGISEGLRREFLCEETVRRYEVLSELSCELGRPINQVALAALLCDGELEIMPIIGGKTEEQIRDSFAALDVKISREQFEEIIKTR